MGTATKVLDLIDSIDYADGVITPRVEVDDPAAEAAALGDFEIVETGLRGWGSANAVIRSDGQYYLARIG